MDITPHLHPWAYEGCPQGNIAAIELYATLCLYSHIATSFRKAIFSIPMATDTIGNAYRVTTMKSKRPRAAAMLAAIAETQQ